MVCAGVLADTSGLEAGELKLYSAVGARIVLKSNGDAEINGVRIGADGTVYARNVILT